MTPRIVMGHEVIMPLRKLGIIPETASKIVISAEMGKEVKLVVQALGTTDLLQVPLFQEEALGPEPIAINPETGEIRRIGRDSSS